LSHQLMAVQNRLQDLERNIIDTWHAKVDNAIIAENLGETARWTAFGKGQMLAHALEDARDELEPRIWAELSRLRYQHAVAAHRGIACSRCGSALQAPLSFRAIELACSCGARTLFDPGDVMRSVAAIGAHAIAQEAVVMQFRAMRAALRALNAI